MGNLVGIYPTLGADTLPEIVSSHCILCFQSFTCLECRVCALYHNNSLESPLVLLCGSVELQGFLYISVSVSTRGTSDLDHFLRANTDAGKEKSTQHSKLMREDLLLISPNKMRISLSYLSCSSHTLVPVKMKGFTTNR